MLSKGTQILCIFLNSRYCKDIKLAKTIYILALYNGGDT